MFVAFWVHNFANKVAEFACTPDTGVHAQASLALRLNELGCRTSELLKRKWSLEEATSAEKYYCVISAHLQIAQGHLHDHYLSSFLERCLAHFKRKTLSSEVILHREKWLHLLSIRQSPPSHVNHPTPLLHPTSLDFINSWVAALC